MRLRTLAGAGTLALFAASAGAAVLPYRWDKVAEIGATYTGFGAPALNDNGVAAFVASTPDGSGGIYFGNHFLVQRAPEGVGYPVVDINNAGQIAFARSVASPPGQRFPDQAVYRWDPNVGTVEIGRTFGVIEEFLSGGPTLNNAGTVAFAASSTIRCRALKGNGTGPTQAVGFSAGNIGGAIINNAGNVAYISYGGNFGTFLQYNDGTDRTVVSASSFGPFMMFTDPDTGGTGPFTTVRGFDVGDSDRVVFSARWNSLIDALYLWDDGTITKVAGTDGLIGIPAVNDLGVVAGIVSGNGPERLAIFEAGVEGTILSVGWAFDGSTVTDLHWSPEGFNNLNQAAFLVSLADGRLVTVIAQLPEPGSVGMFVFAGAGMLLRRKRTH